MRACTQELVIYNTEIWRTYLHHIPLMCPSACVRSIRIGQIIALKLNVVTNRAWQAIKLMTTGVCVNVTYRFGRW